MWNTIRQNVLFLFVMILTFNMIAVSYCLFLIYFSIEQSQKGYDVIDCADAAAHVHKCIRIDASVGEINNANGASYRVIWGH